MRLDPDLPELQFGLALLLSLFASTMFSLAASKPLPMQRHFFNVAVFTPKKAESFSGVMYCREGKPIA